MANELTDPWEPKVARNMDVVGLIERIDRFAFDMVKFESAYINEVTQYDLERIRSYQSALRTYASVLNDATAMDLPHSFPAQYEIHYLTDQMDFDHVKNKTVRDIIRLYVNLWVQWSRSESADKSNGFLIFDYNRFLLIMDRIDYYIDNYTVEALPLDLPESSAFEDGDKPNTSSSRKR